VKLPRPLLHAARIADAVLFWPVLALVMWGQLNAEVPGEIAQINDKLLHFSAYFVLGAMAGGAIRRRGQVKWAVLGLIILGTVLELIQASVGRDTSFFDGVTNAAGAIAGAGLARFVLDPLRRQWGYGIDEPPA
jgi:VanZ family protein